MLQAIEAGAETTAVNVAEVATRYVARGAADDTVRALKERLPFPILPVDADTALLAALMARVTRRFGLSLGDRICLAHARIAGRPVLTADRAWLDVAFEIGVEVVLLHR